MAEIYFPKCPSFARLSPPNPKNTIDISNLLSKYLIFQQNSYL